MKKIILSVVIVLLGMTTGCRVGCTPYDCCGPIYSNPHNCDPNYRSGSVFNADSVAPVTTEGSELITPVQEPTSATSTGAPEEATSVPVDTTGVPAASPVSPAPTAVPAPLPSAEVPVDVQSIQQ